MKHAWFLIAALLSSGPAFAEDPRSWGQRLADSTIAEHPDAWSMRKSDGEYRWAYTQGLVTLGMYRLHLKHDEPDYYAYMKAYVDHYVEADGSIRTLALDEFNIDSINSGKLLFPLLEDTGDPRYRSAIEVLHRQLVWQPRTTGGVFWHKRKYPWQVWLDGLYMGAPFYAEYAARFDRSEVFDDVARQFRESYAKLRDPDTGLLYHGWDESRVQRWSNPDTGRSPGFWTRSLGWYSMALVDTYEHFPAEHEGRSELAGMLRGLSDALLAVRDPRSRLWWQVPNQGGREGNYLEASGSAMIAYAWAKGARLGMLEPSYLELARQSFDGLVEELVDWDAKTGRTELRNVCRSAGLGGKPYRDGSYAYYVSTDVVTNDAHGVGAFLLASAEIEGARARSEALAAGPSDPWGRLPGILAGISAPTFPDRDFRVTDFGAAGDGATDATAAIRAAVDACAGAGGGRVVVPAGEYLTGPIHLKSNVELHLEEGATLLFSRDPGAYLPVVLTRWEGVELMNYSPLVYAHGETNVAVTGKGTLDGQAGPDHWWPWKASGHPQSQKGDRDQLFAQAEAGVPVAERVYGAGHYLRPSFLQAYRSKNVLIEGITIKNAPMWVIHPVLSQNVIVRGVTIISHGPNNDGCNPESSTDVLIEDSLFDTGDDCIAIKSGRNADGRRLAAPSERIVIRGCRMRAGHGGVTIGSEVSGSVRDVFVEQTEMSSPDLDRGIRIKTNAVRGGVIENVFVRDVEIGETGAAIHVDMNYEEGAAGPFVPVVRNILVERLSVRQARYAFFVRGLSVAPVRGIVVRDSVFREVLSASVLEHVEDLVLHNVVIEPAE